MSDNDVLWVEKYRPNKLNTVVLPKKLKVKFEEIIKSGVIPNMVLSGTPGIGKTTVAKILCNTLDVDYMIINGSMYGNIDTLRVKIHDFAVTSSFKNKRKCVILDEADYLNAQSTQPALRNFMEEFSDNCAFIMTCNELNKIIEPLRSRCVTVDFTPDKKDKKSMMTSFYKLAVWILDNEKMTFDKTILANVIENFYPDWRKILSELQYHTTSGELDSAILSGMEDEDFKSLILMMQDKNFTEIRKWVGENAHIPTNVVFRKLYDNASALLEPSSVPSLVVLIAQYQDYDTRVVDKEINMAAFFAEVLGNVVWK